jgi:hypothetical protein
MKTIYNFAWIFLLIAMAGDLIVSFILSFFYNDYSNLKMSISALGNPGSPVRIPFNIWMLMEGMMFLVVLPALYKRYYPISAGLTYTVIALAFFVLFVMSDKPEFSNTIINNEGLWERLNLIFMYAPLLVVSIRQIIKG